MARTYHAKGSGYFPSRSAREGGFKDRLGKKLNTLEDYIAKRADYVSVAMDGKLNIQYGTVVKIPEIEAVRKRAIDSASSIQAAISRARDTRRSTSALPIGRPRSIPQLMAP